MKLSKDVEQDRRDINARKGMRVTAEGEGERRVAMYQKGMSAGDVPGHWRSSGVREEYGWREAAFDCED